MNKILKSETKFIIFSLALIFFYACNTKSVKNDKDLVVVDTSKCKGIVIAHLRLDSLEIEEYWRKRKPTSIFQPGQKLKKFVFNYILVKGSNPTDSDTLTLVGYGIRKKLLEIITYVSASGLPDSVIEFKNIGSEPLFTPPIFFGSIDFKRIEFKEFLQSLTTINPPNTPIKKLKLPNHFEFLPKQLQNGYITYEVKAYTTNKRLLGSFVLNPCPPHHIIDDVDDDD